jgi:ABC-type sugar transport system substrate-binding protein
VGRRAILRSAGLVTAAVAALAMGVSPAGADASGHASCIGIEASSISPPGSSDEFPGGMNQLVHFVKDEAGKVGPVASAVARLHEGSHAACDEATEG